MIGAGVIGAAVAQRLAEKGIAVILLDRADPRRHNGRIVRLGEREPKAASGLLRSERGGDGGLSSSSLATGPGPWYHLDGNLIWFRDPARAAALRENVQRLQAWGYAAEMLPARVVLADLEPGLAIPNPETPVGWFSREAWVDAPTMTRRLVEAVRNAGPRPHGTGPRGRRHREGG